MKRGLIALSLAGHDENNFMVVLDANEKEALVCDGKSRKLEKPKRKNIIHLKATTKSLDEKILESNRSIRIALGQLKKASNDSKQRW